MSNELREFLADIEKEREETLRLAASFPEILNTFNKFFASIDAIKKDFEDPKI